MGSPRYQHRGSASANSNCSGPGVPTSVMLCCCNKEGEDARRLVNVDAMEELIYFKEDKDEEDRYEVCECCGVLTKFDNGDSNKNQPTPVKYARRQRFTFNDEKNPYAKVYVPPWPFHNECLSVPPIQTGGCCNEFMTGAPPYVTGNCADPDSGLPNKSGVYYYNRTLNKLIFQTRKCNKCKKKPETPSQDGDEDLKPPMVIQPLLPGCCPPGCNNPCCAPTCGCNPCCAPPCGVSCCNPCCAPPCGVNCWNPCCNPCGGCSPPGCFGCNPCCGPPCGMFCCPPKPECPPTTVHVNSSPAPPPPPPPPPPPAQTTVIPMCIPIQPPPPCPPPCCVPCCCPPPPRRKKKKRRDETIIEFNNCEAPNCCCPNQPGFMCQVEGCSNGVGNVGFNGMPMRFG